MTILFKHRAKSYKERKYVPIYNITKFKDVIYKNTVQATGSSLKSRVYCQLCKACFPIDQLLVAPKRPH
jgi:hypothetical protein